MKKSERLCLALQYLKDIESITLVSPEEFEFFKQKAIKECGETLSNLTKYICGEAKEEIQIIYPDTVKKFAQELKMHHKPANSPIRQKK